MAAENGDDMRQALLPDDERDDLREDVATVSDTGQHDVDLDRQHSNECREIIVHQPFNLLQFLHDCYVRYCQWIVDIFTCCLGAVWPGLAGPPKLSLLQAERLERLRMRIAEQFNPAHPNHGGQLQRLWELAFPGEPVPEGSLKSPKWKDIGFQGEDPATDFRGAGALGLANLVYMAEEHPSTFQMLVSKSEGVRSDWEYPFAAAGLNITFMLADSLGLISTSVGHAPAGAPATHSSAPDVDEQSLVPRTKAGLAFLPLMADSENAFEELYVAASELLDRVWLQRKASYMQFNQVLSQTRKHVEAALISGKAGTTLQQACSRVRSRA